MTRPSPTRYRTLNWPAYNAALRERGSLTLWFDPKMTWDAAPTGRRGGRQAYSDEAIRACLTIKVVFGLPLRQTAGFVASLLRLAGLDWTVPDYSTLCRRQRTLAARLPYRGSKGPLHLLVDSTGIKVRGEGEWHARKHGGARRRVWRKVHLGIDEGEEDQERPRWGVCPTNMEVRAVEITGSHVGDAPFVGGSIHWIDPWPSSLPDLIGQIPADERIGSGEPWRTPTAPTIPAVVTMRSPIAVPMPSFRPVGTRGHGSRTPQAPWPETRPCGRRSPWADPSGDA